MQIRVDSKFKNSPLPSTAVDHFKNAVLAIGLTVRDMLHKWNKAASFALVNRGRPRGCSKNPKAFMILRLYRCDSDRIWLYGGVAMAGQEIKGDLWDQSLRLDLLPPIACAGFRTLFLASVQKFGEQRPTFNEISSRSSIALMQVDPCIKKDVLRKIWINWFWEGILGLSNMMIQWSFCVDPTP